MKTVFTVFYPERQRKPEKGTSNRTLPMGEKKEKVHRQRPQGGDQKSRRRKKAEKFANGRKPVKNQQKNYERVFCSVHVSLLGPLTPKIAG